MGLILAFLVATCLISYSLSTILLWVKIKPLLGMESLLGLIGLISQGYLLYTQIETGHGQNLSTLNIFSMTTWIIVIFVFIFTLSPKFRRHRTLLVIIYPLTILSILFSLALPESQIIETSKHKGMMTHVLLSVAAMSFLALGALQALMYALLDWGLKRSKNQNLTNLLSKMPPLQSMEALLFKLLSVGTLLLTFSLYTGICYHSDWFSPHLLPKTLFTLIAWLYFITLIAGRHFWGWRGKKAVQLTLLGTLFLLLGYYGTKFTLKVGYT